MLLYLIIFLSSFSFAQEVLKFEDLPGLVEGSNKKVTAAVLDLNASEMRLGYFRRSFLPQVQASLGHETFETGPYRDMSQPFYSLRGAVNLYRGGRDQLEDKARRSERNGMDAVAERTLQEELFEARELFWNLVYLREIRNLYLKTLEQNVRNLQSASKRINAGLATKVDRLEFEVSGTQLDQDLARVEVDISNHQRKIAALVGKSPETQFSTIDLIPHSHDDPTAKETLNFALYRDVRMEMANQLNLETSSQILKRWWVPNFEVYAESTLFTFREREYFPQRDRVDNAIGFQLALSFDGFQQKKDGEALSARARASSLRAEQIKAETEADFNTAKQELTLLHDLIHEGEKNVEKGQDYLNAILGEYSRGIKNSPDVLSASLKNLEFRKRFAELRRDYAIVNAKLESMLAHHH